VDAGPLRVALLGYGLGGAAFHAPLIATTPGLRLTAVATGDPGRQAAVRARYPDATVYPSPAELLIDAAGFDVAVVSTPNATHVPLARASLDAGLPVVVDKPVAATAEEVRDLLRHAATRGRLLVPFHNRRWDGDFRTVARLVADGRMGRVRRFESRFERWRPDPPAGGGVGKDDPAPGAAGGILYDLGPHLVDQALALWGRPAQVYAEIDVRRPGVHVDDDAFVALTWPRGPRAHLWMSAVAAQAGPRFRVLGSAAAFVKHGMDPQESALRAGRLPTEEGFGEEAPAAWGLLGTDERAERVPTMAGAYREFYVALAASLRTGAPPPVAGADAVAVLEVLDAARRSAASGTVAVLEGRGTAGR